MNTSNWRSLILGFSSIASRRAARRAQCYIVWHAEAAFQRGLVVVRRAAVRLLCQALRTLTGLVNKEHPEIGDLSRIFSFTVLSANGPRSALSLSYTAKGCDNTLDASKGVSSDAARRSF